MLLAYFTISAAALCTAALTLYSGFGLGTLLLPVFALFLPVEMAVAATAVVHSANNIFKIAVVGRHADRFLVLHFGIPAIVAAFAGAAALGYLTGSGELWSYKLGGKTAVISPLKLVMAGLMFFFALSELLPTLRGLRFNRRYLVLGGILSGFFGGLSGHQGALRSAFLTKAGITTEAFVGTNAVIGFMVDMARIATYTAVFFLTRGASPADPAQWPLILTGMAAAFSGVLIGKRFLRKIEMKTVQILTGILLFGIALALGAGLI